MLANVRSLRCNSNLVSSLVILWLLAAVCVSLTGCGGGGGGDGTYFNPPIDGGGGGGNQNNPPTSVIRRIQPGNRVVYSVSGTATSTTDGDTKTMQMSGTITATVHECSTLYPGYDGRPLKIVWNWSGNMSGVPFTYSVTEYIEQGDDGTIYYRGSAEYGLIANSDKPVIYYKSPMSRGLTWDWEAVHENGDRRQVYANVLGVETVSGQSAYKIHNIESGTIEGIPANSEYYDWFAPSWGFSVRQYGRVTQVMEIDGTPTLVTLDLNMIAVSKNF
jgi:hypothetical protein